VRFGASDWLWGAALALLLTGVLVARGFRLAKDKRTFGHVALVEALLTSNTSVRRTLRAVLLVLAVLLAAFAAAAPQYGRGTRVLPATNLDVILVLDYSKSMYAKDVSPSRMKRAKVEVARLIEELGGARFGAVAFAGDTMAFPVTSDGAAIAQFFRGLEPVDMPIGGTSIARALDTARELLARDPLSARHERVIVLVTDGEDLEGDPAEVAARIAADGTRIEVVQIGGRTPEPMYEVDENGREIGLRRDRDGQLMTTFLTPEGEAQLEKVASSGGGKVVRAEKGEVGIDQITERLRKLMTEELSERVETVYADIYHYPLSAAVLLLLLDVVLSLGPKRKLPPDPPRGVQRRRLPSRMRKAAVLLALGCLGCADFDRLFMRDSPVVNDAIEALATNQQKVATELLTKYLETGACEAGVIGAGERARRLGDAGLDLGLALASAFPKAAAATPSQTATAKAPSPLVPGALGSADPAAPPGGAPPSGIPAAPATEVDPEVSARIDCALRVLSPVAENPDLTSELRARAHYLMGNLELSRNAFQAAIDAYDRAIVLAPGLPEKTGDAIGRDIAHNRAVAQRRQQEEEERKKKEEEEKKDDQQDQKDDQQGQDQKDQQDQQGQDQDDQQDQKDDQQDQKDQQGQDQKDQQPGQDPKDQPGPDDQQKGEQPGEPPASDAPQDGDAPMPEESAGQNEPQGKPNAPAASQDTRILDRLEQAPTLQQHDAKQKARTIRLRPTMEDK